MQSDPLQHAQQALSGILCPFCGTLSKPGDRCEHCRGVFEPLSRQASQNEMGPWFIRDTDRPFQPGCSFNKLKGLIAKGRITQDSVIRGPTTGQFWQLATKTPSIANLLGTCHSCQTTVGTEDIACKRCRASFAPVGDRQHLGLGPIRLLPGTASPAQIAASSHQGHPDSR